MPNDKKKILLLYLKTGGGHLAPAKAVAKHCEKYYREIAEPVLVDGFTETNKVIKYLVEDGYRELQNKAKWFYELLYALNKISFAAKINCTIISIFTKIYLKKIIDKANPAGIVIFHFFLIQPIYELKKKYKFNIPLFTVVTDPYIAHPMWFLKKEQNFIVFSEKLKNHIQKRLPKSKVNLFSFILDEKFSEQLTDEKIKRIKKEYGYAEEEKIILILGGGDGIPKGEKIIKLLLKNLNNTPIVIVCGKNKSLYKIAEQLKQKYKADNLRIYGYVNFIPELLNISHIVVTKCGASTIMEILILKKVPVVNEYIWEQEKGNIDFLRDNNLGIYEPDINMLPIRIRELLFDENLYLQYKNNITHSNLKNGTEKVTKFLIENIIIN